MLNRYAIIVVLPNNLPSNRIMEDFYETGYSPLSERRGRDKKRAVKFVAIIIITLALILIALGIIGATAGKNPSVVTPTPTIPSVQVLPTETPIPSPTPEDDEITPSPVRGRTPTPTPSKPAATKVPDRTPTPAKTTPAPTSTSGVNRSDLSIEIQNGSGISGAAGQASTLLKGLGYKVLSTGNADNFDYEQTVVKVKAEKKAFLNQLKLDLESEYTVESATSDLTGSTADAVVIVGRE